MTQITKDQIKETKRQAQRFIDFYTGKITFTGGGVEVKVAK